MIGFLDGLSSGDLESTTYFSTAMEGFKSGDAIADVRNKERSSVFVGKSARGALFCAGDAWRLALWAGDDAAASASGLDAE